MNCTNCHQPVPDGRPIDECPNCLLARATATTTGENFGYAGPYLLTGKLGEGAFGEVFFGEQHEPMYREAAVKLLKRDFLNDPNLTSRFRAETQALTVLDHPNIARLFEAGTTESGQPFIALELISGTPITDWCRARDLSIDEKLTLIKKVCAAMQHAHERGLVHRDLKPDNILVDLESGEPKVIDFGVARSTTTLLQKDAMLTGALDIIGTPAYLSPEQTDGGSDHIDARSDIYALGVVLYELLTGRTPIDATGESHFELLKSIRETPAAPPSKIDPTISPNIDAAILKALAKRPDERFRTADQLSAALDGNPDLATDPGSRKKHLILGAIILATITTGVILLPKNPSSTPPPNAQFFAGYSPPFTLVAHDFFDVAEGAVVASPFTDDSKFNWFHFRDSDGENLFFAADSEYESDTAGQFIIGAKSIDQPGAKPVEWDSPTDRLLLGLLDTEYRSLPQDEWDRLEALSYDDIVNDSETRQRKLFLERYLTISDRRDNRKFK